jgi:hypothetical protein
VNKVIDENFWPMQLSANVTGHLMERDSAKETIKGIASEVFPQNMRQALGLFIVPEERHQQTKTLQQLYHPSQPLWITFLTNKDQPIGWFYGYMEDEMTFLSTP